MIKRHIDGSICDDEDELGSFTTQDTYRGDGTEPTTLNYYTYCAGDPVNYTDPTGHSFKKRKKKARRIRKKPTKKSIKSFFKKVAGKAKKAVSKRYPNAYRKAARVYNGAKKSHPN